MKFRDLPGATGTMVPVRVQLIGKDESTVHQIGSHVDVCELLNGLFGKPWIKAVFTPTREGAVASIGKKSCMITVMARKTPLADHLDTLYGEVEGYLDSDVDDPAMVAATSAVMESLARDQAGGYAAQAAVAAYLDVIRKAGRV